MKTSGHTRALALAAAVAACLAVLAAPAGTSAAPAAAPSPARTSSFEQSVIARINGARRSHGLAPLRIATTLSRAADAHGRSMASGGYFSHFSRDGTSPSTRIRRYYGGSTVGETLLWRSPDVTAAQAVRMWLQSTPHRAILLGSGFREIGLAAIHLAQAGGTFGRGPVTILVADFGAR